MAKLTEHKIVDWPSKERVITSFAGGGKSHTRKSEMIRFYYPDVSEPIEHNISTNLLNLATRNGKFRSTYTEKFFELILHRIGFRGAFIEFCEIPYEEWCERCSDEFRAHLKESGAVSSAPVIRFHAPDLSENPIPDWDEEGAVDQRYMFADRESPLLWNDVRQDRSGDSHPYRHCTQTLTSTIASLAEDLKKVDELILLGAGSGDKDCEIISAIAKSRKSAFRVILCDASFHMLVDEYSELEDLVSRTEFAKYAHIELCCFDFSKRRGWQICGLQQGATRLFCIFGGTIGNVDEDGLFTALSDNFNERSALIIGASFYTSRDDIHEHIKEDVAKQYGIDAKRIGLTAISRTLDKFYEDLSLRDRLRLVHCDPMSLYDNHELPEIIQSRVPDTWGPCLPLDFVTGRGKFA